MDKVLTKVKLYVNDLFNRRNKKLKYHNLHHTETVVERAFEISRACSLPQNEWFRLITAAWFHDTGHLFNELSEHEKAGADLMGSFLQSHMIAEEEINIIAECILVTKMPSHPRSLIQEIICDADTYHFGTKEFLNSDRSIYEELETRFSKPVEDPVEKSIRLLESHQFFTPYCRELLNKGKQDNIDWLRRSVR